MRFDLRILGYTLSFSLKKVAAEKVRNITFVKRGGQWTISIAPTGSWASIKVKHKDKWTLTTNPSTPWHVLTYTYEAPWEDGFMVDFTTDRIVDMRVCCPNTGKYLITNALTLPENHPFFDIADVVVRIPTTTKARGEAQVVSLDSFRR